MSTVAPLPWRQDRASITEMAHADTSAIGIRSPHPPPDMVEDISNISIMMCVQNLLRGIARARRETYLPKPVLYSSCLCSAEPQM